MRATFEFKGVDEYLSRLKDAGGDIEDAAIRCVEEGRDIQYDEMIKGLERHKRTGRAVASLEKPEVTKEGTIFTAEICVGDEGWQGAIFQEFGAPHFRKDPWKRPAEESTRSKIRKRWKEIFTEKGVTVK